MSEYSIPYTRETEPTQRKPAALYVSHNPEVRVDTPAPTQEQLPQNIAAQIGQRIARLRSLMIDEAPAIGE
jgi:hypothetical protein